MLRLIRLGVPQKRGLVKRKEERRQKVKGLRWMETQKTSSLVKTWTSRDRVNVGGNGAEDKMDMQAHPHPPIVQYVRMGRQKSEERMERAG